MEGVGILGSIVIGLIAGYVAERVTRSRHGLLANLFVGLVGAIVGGLLARLLDLPPREGFLANLVLATIGAVIVLFLWRRIRD